jgi:hypothetical protein
MIPLQKNQISKKSKITSKQAKKTNPELQKYARRLKTEN